MELSLKNILPLIGGLLVIISFFVGTLIVLSATFEAQGVTAGTRITLYGNGNLLLETNLGGGWIKVVEGTWSLAYISYIVMLFAALVVVVSIPVLIEKISPETGAKILRNLSSLSSALVLLYILLFVGGVGTFEITKFWGSWNYEVKCSLSSVLSFWIYEPIGKGASFSISGIGFYLLVAGAILLAISAKILKKK